MVHKGTLGNLCVLGCLRVTFGTQEPFPVRLGPISPAFSTPADYGHNINHCHSAESSYCPVPLEGV